MASLTRGTSFRRQGSSGSTWAYNEEGVLMRAKREQPQILFPGSGSLSKVHIWNEAQSVAPPKSSSSSLASIGAHPTAAGAAAFSKMQPPSPSPSPGSSLGRSKSVGNAPNRPFPQQPTSQKSRSKIMKWLKKTISKLKN